MLDESVMHPFAKFDKIKNNCSNIYMTGNMREALDVFNAIEDEEQSHEARKKREAFIKKVHALLDISLTFNREQYALMFAALDEGKSEYLFHHFIQSADWDEKFAQKGYQFQPAFLIKMVQRENVTPEHQASQTKQMMLAIPVSEEDLLTDETTLGDLHLDQTVYVYWTIEDESGVKELCYEVSSDGVRMANFASESETVADSEFEKFLKTIDAKDFSTLSTGASLVERFRQDIRNLELVAQITEPVLFKNVVQ